jgi:hypothetical protein
MFPERAPNLGHALPVTERPKIARWWRREGEQELRLILWAAWDPIGSVPRDEYDSYVSRIWSLLARRASLEEIAAQLGEYRVAAMGLPAAPNEDLRVASKLLDWLDPPGMAKFRPTDLLN